MTTEDIHNWNILRDDVIDYINMFLDISKSLELEPYIELFDLIEDVKAERNL